jgi:shikimate dehydrogenase
MNQPSRLVLLGHPVAHSLSPAMQTAALRSAGIALTYVAQDVLPEDLGATLDRLRAEGAAGNITVPHKARAVEYCGRVTPLAEQVGAVNTFWVERDTLVGDNTDVGGFRNAVVQLRGALPSHTAIAVIGAGGAAAAVLAAIADWPACEARVWNRTPARAAALVSRFSRCAVVAPSLAAAVADATLVVHATTIGLTDDAVPLDTLALPPGADVMDLVYRPGETAWIRAARANGHRACDGLPMLIEQGALAFERWFARPADRSAMSAAVRSSCRTLSR